MYRKLKIIIIIQPLYYPENYFYFSLQLLYISYAYKVSETTLLAFVALKGTALFQLMPPYFDLK